MNLHELILYDHLAEDPVVIAYMDFLHGAYSGALRKAYFNLVKELMAIGTSFEAYLYQQMIGIDSSVLERLASDKDEPTPMDKASLANDLAIIQQLLDADLTHKLKEVEDSHQLLNHLLAIPLVTEIQVAYRDYFHQETVDGSEKVDQFIEVLKHYGAGAFAIANFFYLDEKDGLQPVIDFQPLTWDHIYDYEPQKAQLEKNTKAIVSGRPFHHALLVGASGTGKSSSVKAIVQKYSQDKLRLVQLYKSQLRRLPNILETLAKAPFKFILFIDDLSFEVNEDDYKLLKSYIEGGVVNDADNIAFYVTSNRQHLIKEVRSDREGDIHLQDFIAEMTSLSRRFGVRLTLEKLQHKRYFAMVAHMLEDEGLAFNREEMEVEARQWSLRHGGMSGRIAMQFVKQVQLESGH